MQEINKIFLRLHILHTKQPVEVETITPKSIKSWMMCTLKSAKSQMYKFLPPDCCNLSKYSTKRDDGQNSMKENNTNKGTHFDVPWKRVKQGLKELRRLGIQHRLLEASRKSVNGYTSPIKSTAFDLTEVLVAARASSGLI
uniref:Uncharacterized protein n=1 Tax=Tanacetum cinerariifolium TaxID=118510 RepID=A0A699GUI3_TANCI|nr:hypothetical protein [Tanacetum cinerariifolium]